MANVSYVNISTLKGTGALNVTSTAFDGRLRQLLENVSEEIDRYTHRHFYPLIETRYFNGADGTRLFVPDLIEVSALKEDNNFDGTYDTTWAVADYQLAPYNAAPTSEWGRPYTRILVDNRAGTQDVFITGQRNYEIAGTWGYQRVTATSGRTGTLANSTTTTLTLDGTVGGTLVPGDSLVIGSEVIYVTTGTVAGGTAVTVLRGQLGSTATAHSNIAVDVVQYPGAIVEAVIIQASRLWKRRDSGFASEVGMPETGQMMVFRGPLDGDVKQLLSPLRRQVV